jgi:hypothetical protein
MKLTSRDRRAVMLGVVALAALLAVRYVLWPLATSWGTARQQIAAADAQLTDLRTRTQRARLQQQRLVDVFGPAAAKSLPTVDEARVSIVNTVQNALSAGPVAAQSVQLQAIRPLPDITGIALVSLQVDATCQLPQLAGFLAKLPQANELIIIQQMNIAVPEGKPGEMQLSLIIATAAQQEPDVAY